MLNEIIKNMDERWYDWQAHGCIFINYKMNVTIWIGSGLFFYGLYEPTQEWFGIIGCIRFLFAYRRWLKKYYAGKNKMIGIEELVLKR